MVDIQKLKQEYGDDFVGFFKLPSLVKGESRGLVIVKPTPAELLFKVPQEREVHENVFCEEGAGVLVYRVFSIEKAVHELLFGKNLELFLAFSSKENLDESTANSNFRVVLEMIFDSFSKLIGEVNDKNFSTMVLKKGEELKVAGDKLFLFQQKLSDDENVDGLMKNYNEMCMLTSFISSIVKESALEYNVESFDDVDFNVIESKSRKFQYVMDKFREECGVYVQLDWKKEVAELVNCINVLTLQSIAI